MEQDLFFRLGSAEIGVLTTLTAHPISSPLGIIAAGTTPKSFGVHAYDPFVLWCYPWFFYLQDARGVIKDAIKFPLSRLQTIQSLLPNLRRIEAY